MKLEEIKKALMERTPVYYKDMNHVVVSKYNAKSWDDYFVLSLTDGTRTNLIYEDGVTLCGNEDDYRCNPYSVEILYDVDTAEVRVAQLFEENNIKADDYLVRMLAREVVNRCFVDDNITEELYEKCDKKLIEVLNGYGYKVSA